MGKMKEMFIIMKDDGMKDLDTLIKKAVRVNADRINFRGTVYTVQKAKQILIFMQNEQRKIRGAEEFAERGPDGDN